MINYIKWIGLIGIVLSWFASLYAVHRYDTTTYDANMASAREDAIKKANSAAEQALTTVGHRLGQIASENVLLKQELTKYVKINDQCNLTVGALRVLNYARSGMPETASGADAESAADTADSGVSEQDALEADRALAIQYRSLAARHDALIDYLERVTK